MKVAIIYSGACRSFDRCLPNHAWFLHRNFPDAHYFFSTYRDGSEHQAELLREKYPGRVEIEIVDKQPVFEFDKPWTPGSFYSHEPYAISVSPQAVMGQLWQMQKAFELCVGRAFDCAIRIRPDIWFHSLEIPMVVNPKDCYLPWWGRFGGCNDRFAIMGNKAAPYYFTAFFGDKRCPVHPESMVKNAVSHCNTHETLKAEFSTMRPNGNLRPPEISLIDLAHVALSKA